MKKEAIVYQMGKVGSSALVEGLKRHGVAAQQSHFLGTDTFQKAVKRFEDPEFPPQAAHHMAHQLMENLLIKSRLVRAKKFGQGEDTEINVVTLARDPLDWYFANLTQNFVQYAPGIAKSVGATSSTQGPLIGPSQLLSFLESVFSVLDDAVTHMDESPLLAIREKVRAERRRDPSERHKEIFVHATYLLRPHTWFDSHFLPVFDVDVLALLEKEGGETLSFESGLLNLLFVKFEALGRSTDAIRDFFDLSSFSLPKANLSAGKKEYSLVADARQGLSLDEAFFRKFYDSRYCRILYPEGWKRAQA